MLCHPTKPTFYRFQWEPRFVQKSLSKVFTDHSPKYVRSNCDVPVLSAVLNYATAYYHINRFTGYFRKIRAQAMINHGRDCVRIGRDEVDALRNARKLRLSLDSMVWAFRYAHNVVPSFTRVTSSVGFYWGIAGTCRSKAGTQSAHTCSSNEDPNWV
jgi:hypothetical protein